MISRSRIARSIIVVMGFLVIWGCSSQKALPTGWTWWDKSSDGTTVKIGVPQAWSVEAFAERSDEGDKSGPFAGRVSRSTGPDDKDGLEGFTMKLIATLTKPGVGSEIRVCTLNLTGIADTEGLEKLVEEVDAELSQDKSRKFKIAYKTVEGRKFMAQSWTQDGKPAERKYYWVDGDVGFQVVADPGSMDPQEFESLCETVISSVSVVKD